MCFIWSHLLRVRFQGKDEPEASPPIALFALPSAGAAQLCSRALTEAPQSALPRELLGSSCSLAPVPDPPSCAASVTRPEQMDCAEQPSVAQHKRNSLIFIMVSSPCACSCFPEWVRHSLEILHGSCSSRSLNSHLQTLGLCPKLGNISQSSL